MRKKTLYILATSRIPDAYINSIAYSVEHKDVGAISVIVIREHDYPEEQQDAELRATEVLANIITQLQNLKAGQYMYIDKETREEKKIPLQNTDHISIYGKCLDLIDRSGHQGKSFEHSKLVEKLRKFVDTGDCIFDVTSLKKNLLIDVFTTLVSFGFGDVYSFELKKEQKFDQTDLYHNIRGTDLFIFRNLIRSEPVTISVCQISKWTDAVRSLFLAACILFLVLIPLSYIWKDSFILTILNIASMVGSIGGFGYLFLKEKSTLKKSFTKN